MADHSLKDTPERANLKYPLIFFLAKSGKCSVDP